MSDIHALSGAYVTHGLDDVERARFERHLLNCPACGDEVDGLAEAASLLAETTIVEPPRGLRARVLRDISTARPLPPIVPAPVVSLDSRRRPGRLSRGLAAAAAAVVLAGTGVAAWHPWSDDSTSEGPAATADIATVLNAPDALHATKKFANGARFTLVRSPKLGRAVMTSNGLAPLPNGRTFEVWLKKGDSYVRAGLLDEGTTDVLLDGDASEALGAAITVEPAGGSERPTSEAVAEFTFEQA